MNEAIFYINGIFTPESKAFVSVSDIGLLRSYGVFDFTITYNRKPFRLEDHLKRLQKSAKLIELNLPWDIEEIERIVYETLDRNPDGEKGIRIMVTGGVSRDSFTPAEDPSLIVMVKPIKVYPKTFFTEGVKVITFEGKREIPNAKTLNYAQAIRALGRARREGAEEALYTFNDIIFECMACSFFAVKDKRIITAGEDVLDGITRRTVLELVEGKIPVEYRFVKVQDLPFLDEAFLTSSNHEVMPIVTVDNINIGDGVPGPITKEVMKLFGEFTGKMLGEDQ